MYVFYVFILVHFVLRFAFSAFFCNTNCSSILVVQVKLDVVGETDTHQWGTWTGVCQEYCGTADNHLHHHTCREHLRHAPMLGGDVGCDIF